MIWVKHKANDMPGTEEYASAVWSSQPACTFRAKGNEIGLLLPNPNFFSLPLSFMQGNHQVNELQRPTRSKITLH